MLRPIAWLAYGRFRFPVSRAERILCTTHHVLPRHAHQIVTVHDLRPYFYPDSRVQSFYFHHLLPQALKRCEGVLTVSETSRQMLMDIYGLEGDKVRVVPNAVVVCSSPRLESGVQSPNRTELEYLLMVGASWEHKNAEELLHMHRHWAMRFKLKIVAGAGAYLSKLERLAEELGIRDKIEFLTDVPDDRLQSLYAETAALVYPSKLEGFGLPPLEAMAHGRPVIVSDIPIFRELYGSFPYFVRLNDENSWGEAFRQLQEDDPADREQRIAHAKSFTINAMGSALQSALNHFWG